MRDATVSWVAAAAERRAIDISILAPEGIRSPTVSVVMLPEGLTTKEVREAIGARGFTVGGGYGQLSETSFRIGHMGDHSVEGVKRCLQVCETAIAELAERKRLTVTR
jgi:aspartate aminotransferase-like enzyme